MAYVPPIRVRPCPSWPFSICASCALRRVGVDGGVSGTSSSAEVVPVSPPPGLRRRAFPGTAVHHKIRILRKIFRICDFRSSLSFRRWEQEVWNQWPQELRLLGVVVGFETFEKEDLKELSELVEVG